VAPSAAQLTLDDDVIPLLRRWALTRSWGRLTIVFKNGQPTDIYPDPHIENVGQLRTHYPRLGGEMEPRGA